MVVAANKLYNQRLVKVRPHFLLHLINLSFQFGLGVQVRKWAKQHQINCETKYFWFCDEHHINTVDVLRLFVP